MINPNPSKWYKVRSLGIFLGVVSMFFASLAYAGPVLPRFSPSRLFPGPDVKAVTDSFCVGHFPKEQPTLVLEGAYIFLQGERLHPVRVVKNWWKKVPNARTIRMEVLCVAKDPEAERGTIEANNAWNKKFVVIEFLGVLFSQKDGAWSKRWESSSLDPICLNPTFCNALEEIGEYPTKMDLEQASDKKTFQGVEGSVTYNARFVVRIFGENDDISMSGYAY